MDEMHDDFSSLIEAYFFFFSRKAAPSTAHRSRITLIAFAEAMRGFSFTSPIEVTGDTLLQHFGRRAKKVRTTTLAREFSVAMGFLKFCEREGYLLRNPFPEGFKVKGPKPRLPRVPSPREMEEAVTEEGLFASELRLRNRAILELAYGSGLRLGELVSLNLKDLKGDEARVRGKGRKERVVPVGGAAREALSRYLTHGRPRLLMKRGEGREEEALFLSRHGERLLHGGYAWLMRRLKAKDPRLHMHLFRHAFATHMLQGGASLFTLQKILGHEKPETTSLYAHYDLKDLKKALARHHPRP